MGAAPTPSSESAGGRPSGSGRRPLLWVLGVTVVVVLMAVSGLVGYVLGGKGEGSVAGGPAIPAAPGTKHLSLRETAVKAMSESDAATQAGDEAAGWKVLKRYAEPACAAMLESFVAAFGSGEDSNEDADSDPTTVVSATENGNRGVVVTKTGNGDPETMHWIRREGVWRFTCEGIFDAGSTTTTSPTDEAEEPSTETTTTKRKPRRTTTAPRGVG